MKNGKRILSVKIKRMMDDSPDTSWIGEYSDSPDSEFSINRATDEFVGDEDAGKEWLDRIMSALENMREVCEEHPTMTEPGCEVCEYEMYYSHALDAVYELREDILAGYFDPRGYHVSGNEYRYFNPATVEPFKADASWIPDEVEDKHTYWLNAMRQNARSDFKRMEEYNQGYWQFIGVGAEAEISIPDGGRTSRDVATAVVQHITSGGLWGIESDSGDYLNEVGQEQLSELKTQLLALGFSRRAISQAFKSVEEVSE